MPKYGNFNISRVKPCPFCGEHKDLQILNMKDVLHWECIYDCEKNKEDIFQFEHNWFVNCPTCGSSGPEVYISKTFGVHTDEECIEQAINKWNMRS